MKIIAAATATAATAAPPAPAIGPTKVVMMN